MKTIEYLRSGKSLVDLHNELHIEVNRHESLPLAILNYNQIESPKTDPIVRECRALVLNTEDWSLVARSFSRFYNWGEVADEMPLFNWDKSVALEKVDGSLILFYKFAGQWRVNTRGSYANMGMFNTEWQAMYHNMPADWTWQQGILTALGIKSLDELDLYLDPSLTYVCEFCSLWNKVVREYKTPCVYLLTCYAGEEEVGPRDVSIFKTVGQYPLYSADDVTEYVNSQPEATWEGCVVKDDANRRWKIKNRRYLSLHKMKGANGDALYNPSTLLPFILEGEGDELLATYPEIKDCFYHYKNKVDTAYNELESLWLEYKDVPVQKDFALSIQGKTPFTGVLFNCRKSGSSLKEEWAKAERHIDKTLFK
ncbi:RNA ligase [Nitrospira sp. BLG_2]|uniref:RNA ligase n=1 Tax=Nitrospira sp. BLG_2 TaxID=3397507 RepID=UPI003B9BA93F